MMIRDQTFNEIKFTTILRERQLYFNLLFAKEPMPYLINFISFVLQMDPKIPSIKFN